MALFLNIIMVTIEAATINSALANKTKIIDDHFTTSKQLISRRESNKKLGIQKRKGSILKNNLGGNKDILQMEQQFESDTNIENFEEEDMSKNSLIFEI